MTNEQKTAPTARATELAAAYMSLLVPTIKRTLAITAKGSGPVLDRLDWVAVMAPLAALFARELTEDELAQSLAWAESPLYAKLDSLQEEVAARIQPSMMAELAKLTLRELEP